MVVGLGNPGQDYEATRHNVGFMVVEELRRRAGSKKGRMEGESRVTRVEMGGADLWLVEPQTFMNRSGPAVVAVAGRWGIEPHEILAIHDDADLPLGSVRIRRTGSSAGHRGMTSLIESLGTREVPRVRLGIGRDPGELAERVLAPFSRSERSQAEKMIQDAADAVETAVSAGLIAAMNKHNRREDPAGA